jgi:Leucine-rich repeat (LRR) protein
MSTRGGDMFSTPPAAITDEVLKMNIDTLVTNLTGARKERAIRQLSRIERSGPGGALLSAVYVALGGISDAKVWAADGNEPWAGKCEWGDSKDRTKWKFVTSSSADRLAIGMDIPSARALKRPAIIPTTLLFNEGFSINFTLVDEGGKTIFLDGRKIYDGEEEMRKAKSIPSWVVPMATMSVIDGLNLQGCKKLVKLPERLGQIDTIQHLDLTNCAKLAALPDSICHLEHLETLTLAGCKKISSLPAGFGGMIHLETLSLSGCSSLSALPASLGQLKLLEVLNLAECSKLSMLPAAIGDLKSLEDLDLSGCRSMSSIQESIGELKNLTKLNLSRCSGLIYLPSRISDLDGLEELILAQCSNLSSIRGNIADLKSLTTLDLEDCKKLKILPKSMGNLSLLMKFSIAFCGNLEDCPDMSHLVDHGLMINCRWGPTDWKDSGFKAWKKYH